MSAAAPTDVDAIAARFPTHGVVAELPAAEVPHDLRTLWGRRGPLVLRGLAQDWPASRTWTFTSLAEKGAGIPVAINRSIREQYGTVSEQRDLGAYLRALAEGDEAVQGGHDQAYLAYSWLLDLIPELRDDLPLRERFGRWSHKLPAAWIGPAGTVTGLHTDNAYPNVLAQIRGRKSVVFFAPGTEMYVTGKYEFVTCTSAVDLQRLDFERFPQLRRAVPLVAHLDEGDGVYIPPRWWHFVVAQTPSISVSTFFGTARHFAPMAPEELTKNVLHRLGLYRRGNCICHS